jgi:hypothetical protein
MSKKLGHIPISNYTFTIKGHWLKTTKDIFFSWRGLKGTGSLFFIIPDSHFKTNSYKKKGKRKKRVKRKKRKKLRKKQPKKKASA